MNKTRGSILRSPLALAALAACAVGGAPGCGTSRSGGAEGETPPGSVQPGPGPGPGGSGGPVEQAAECKKVDILFVIDNSGSMADNQKSLIASFPGFVDGMKKRLANAQDFHVGIVTSDAYYSNQPGCTAIGSLVTRTGGPLSSKMECGPYEGGGRYMVGGDSRLKERFACAAQVGAGGSDDERMARAFLGAVSPKVNQPGACNAGFLRPDSLLVVVMITDEDDVPDLCDGDGMCQNKASGGTPDDWYAEFLTYRSRPENVVMLSLLGRQGGNACGAVPASRLMRLTNKFGKNAFLGDVCAPSYDSFFEGALPVIHQACKVFIPG